MNTIVTTYPGANGLRGRPDPKASLWGWIRNAVRAPASPAAALVRDPVREANEVRAMANTLRSSDPRFAADLYAAADRHECLYGDADGGNR